MTSHRSKPQDPLPASFLGLPRELRDKVYRELLLQDLVWEEIPKTFPLDEDKNHYNFQLSILSVNKQIHEEASQVMYRENC